MNYNLPFMLKSVITSTRQESSRFISCSSEPIISQIYIALSKVLSLGTLVIALHSLTRSYSNLVIANLVVPLCSCS